MLPRGFDRFHRVPCGWTFGIKRGRQKRLPAVFRRDCRPGLVEALERARAVLGAKGSVFFLFRREREGYAGGTWDDSRLSNANNRRGELGFDA